MYCDGDLVFVQNYHLLLVPWFLRQVSHWIYIIAQQPFQSIRQRTR